jgi:nitrate/nitrite transporter NarK
MWTIPFDVFSRTDGTKIAGMMITGGSIGGIVAPTMVGYILRETGSFDMVYYSLAGLEFFAFLLALALFFKERSVHKAA